MNKKKLLMFGLPLLAISMVMATIGYYALFQQELSITQPIDVSESTNTIECMSGDTCPGDAIVISNAALTERSLLITNDADPEIEVTYTGELELTKKDVVFGDEVWIIPGDAEKVQVKYTAIGDSFEAEVTDGAITDYVLIYYKDNSDRFNEPAEAILVEGNDFPYLPYESDKNSEVADEYDYCGEYDTCHGAKIWYVPSTAILSGGELDWSKASDFYFESELIQYNAEGNIIIYGEDTITLTPEYSIGAYMPTNDSIIITTQVA